MTGQGLYERVIEALGEGAELAKPKPPRPSAAVVLWRFRPRGGLEVFWVERSAELRFMGGWHAFPGGGVSRRDSGIEVLGRPLGIDRAPADGAMPEAVTENTPLGPLLVDGLIAGALRELFEETGILLTAFDRGASPSRQRLELAQASLLAKETGFAELLADLGVTLDCSDLVYAGRWLTPPLGPMRFDNRFFLLEWPEERETQPRVIPGELSSGEWIDPTEAYRRWEAEDVITAPPILHILRVLMEEGPDRGLERLWSPVEANLGAFRMIEFRPGLLLFPLPTPTLPPATHTNCYVLGLEECVLVDPGTPFTAELERFAAALDSMADRIGRRVSAIWLTHHHPDHVGGVERLRRALDVPVLAHPLTADRLAEVGISIDEELLGGQSPRLLRSKEPYALRVLHTPGHARGHLCFYDELRRTLVVGDMVAGYGTIVIDPPEGDMDDYLDSLERLRDLGPVTLCPAHGPTIQDGRRKLEEYIAHRLQREELVLTAWNGGCRHPSDMIDPVYGDLDRMAHPLAVRQLRAHLERLERAGRIVLGTEDR